MHVCFKSSTMESFIFMAVDSMRFMFQSCFLEYTIYSSSNPQQLLIHGKQVKSQKDTLPSSTTNYLNLLIISLEIDWTRIILLHSHSQVIHCNYEKFNQHRFICFEGDNGQTPVVKPFMLLLDCTYL